jgi:uncharacterized heparinase superfamily protein
MAAMSFGPTFARLRRLVRRRPGYLIGRAMREFFCEFERWHAPRRERNLDLLKLARVATIDELWTRLAARPYPAVTAAIDAAELDRIEPGETARILSAAARACGGSIELLGSGSISVGRSVDWSRDYRVGKRWDPGFARSIDYINRDLPSDVKIPWEISRLQWLMPAGQAYVLTADEQYAVAVRDVIEHWITANPLAYTVNWSCAMEAAMRIVTWTWFFHVFARSSSWADPHFRRRFLSALYLHVDFTLRHIEHAEVNSNHYTADLTGLLFGGLFFGEIGNARQWLEIGWRGLTAEIERQVHPDGVVHEASCAYHRLVFELFMWSALFWRAAGHKVPRVYEERLRGMARFTASYARTDGSSPLWGDADDARVLPFGGQPIGDHRYLVGIAAIALGDSELAAMFEGPRSELVWIFGSKGAARLSGVATATPASAKFPDGGCYVMRHRNTHIFIDCGPIGLGGRGGHGHNDALSFEAWLEGSPLLIDCGSYVYTSSFEARNRFRSTASHNTPMVDEQEINRFLHHEALWDLHDDARPACLQWQSDEEEDIFIGTHYGYTRLALQIRRTLRLSKRQHTLRISDEFVGEDDHSLVVPLHLAPTVTVGLCGDTVKLHSAGRVFVVAPAAADKWTFGIEPCQVSPSYGVALPSHRLVWSRTGSLPASLTIVIRPDAGGDS